jgi:hypothetical protein
LLDGRLLVGIGIGVARAWTLGSAVEAMQVVRAPLPTDMPSDARLDPCGDLAPIPQPAVGWWRVQCRVEIGERGGIEQRCATGIGVPAITDTGSAAGVVALDESAHPAGRVAGGSADTRGRLPLTDEPEDLPVGAGDGIMSLTVEAAQLLGRVVRREPQLLRHNAALYTRSWYGP